MTSSLWNVNNFHPLGVEAIATHNFKLVKIAHICVIWDLTFANFVVQAHISFAITVIQPGNKID